MKIWNKQNDDEVFVRWCLTSKDLFLFLCDESGNVITLGYLMDQGGYRHPGVDRDAAEKAGVTLDRKGRISDESIAELIRELAREN